MITNTPLYPDWVMWEQELSADTCEKIIEACSDLESHGATTVGTDGLDPRRITQVSWLSIGDEKFSWIRDIVEEYTHKAGEIFNVDLTELQPIQFTEYNYVGSHYDMHHDVEWDNQRGNHRKVSLVLQLSDSEDYEGGDFKFHEHISSPDSEALRKRGTIIAFLSYNPHCVEPIITGQRKSLVAWHLGPRWK